MIEYSIVILLGLAFGSFAVNVSEAFIANKKIDLKRSLCRCGNRKLSLAENIPLVSYVLFNANCKVCKNSLPKRYLIIEITSALLAVLSYFQAENLIEGSMIFFTTYLLLIIAVIDYEKYIIPNEILVFLLSLAAINAVINPEDILVKGIVAILLGVILILANKFSENRSGKNLIGYGDIKLLFVLFLFDIPLISLLGLWISSVMALLFFYFRKKIFNSLQKKIPFGLTLFWGYAITFQFGNYFIDYYLKLAGINFE